MKSYSIGREESCNIIVNDPTQMVSRRHATLNVDGRKMSIVDTSSNGTYINGIRISSGTPVPVTRKDKVSFAQVAELDWRCVPNGSGKKWGFAVGVVAAVLAVGLITFCMLQDKGKIRPVKQGDKGEVAWSQLGDRIEAMKKDIATITGDYKVIGDTLKFLKTSLDTKDVSEKKSSEVADSVKKIFWKLEDALKNVNPNELQKSLDGVAQSYGDKVSSTESRVEELEKTVKTCKETMENAIKLVGEASQSISSLKEKSKAQTKSQTGDKSKEPKKDTIVVPM